MLTVVQLIVAALFYVYSKLFYKEGQDKDKRRRENEKQRHQRTEQENNADTMIEPDVADV